MSTSSLKNLLNEPSEEYFDGIRLEKHGAEGPSLDLRTLNEIQTAAAEYGMSEFGTGSGRAWTLTKYKDGTYDVLGVHTSEGLQPTKKRKKSQKPRAKKREQMSDTDVERSLRRTKKKVRETAIQLQPDKLLTFTTRKAIVEVDVFKKVVSIFIALCRKELSKLEYIAVFERHMSDRTSAAKYGSLHMHMATKGYVDYKKITELWRRAVQSVTKDGDFEGANIDASSRKKGHHDTRSIARYISKYMTKDMDDEYYQPSKRRYWASKGIEKPEKTRLFSPPAGHNHTFMDMFEDIIGQPIRKFFQPDRMPGQPCIVWMSTG